ncbi:hypothetical protein GCM10009547_29120 [Sporichthya brevicatena]|uniref:CBU-0592-like domain-containing protein n=1 Tax=Sporichthya brevicatena TaxID=171442 RepID=A0ABN1GZ29_9ACTN
MGQIVQLVGAFLVLAGFIGNQRFGLSTGSPWYLLANALGSSILATVAATSGNYGFLLLNVVWAVVAIVGLVRLAMGRPATA